MILGNNRGGGGALPGLSPGCSDSILQLRWNNERKQDWEKQERNSLDGWDTRVHGTVLAEE